MPACLPVLHAQGSHEYDTVSDRTWRTHSCVPRRHSCRRPDLWTNPRQRPGVEKNRDTASTSARRVTGNFPAQNQVSVFPCFSVLFPSLICFSNSICTCVY